MKETTLSKPSTSLNHSSHSSDEEEYQVDNLSTSSCRDTDDETENTIVVSNEAALPTIESVSVVNSNDVHIGNKTVYKGPVTIKQIVYPNGAISSECVHNLEQSENKVSVNLDGFPVTRGVDNPSFVKDAVGQYKDDNDKAAQNDNLHDNLISSRKGILWLRKFKKHTYVLIFLSALVVAIIIFIALKYWIRVAPGYVVNDGDSYEQENNTPWIYSTDSNETINERLRIVPRQQWLAQPPVQEADLLKTPVPLVIIQHTATESCSSMAQCIYHVRQIQTYHIESNHWWDIGYNFLVGGDGAAYEGRGWKYEGAHTFGYNYKSIGVGFVGTFNSEVPPKNQIAAFKKLVAKGVELGYIKKDYKILAARQLYGTESPGAVFYKEIETWPHWAKEP